MAKKTDQIETAADLIKNLSDNQAVKPKRTIRLSLMDGEELSKKEDPGTEDFAPLLKSVLNVLNQGSITRLSFTVDPTLNNNYGNIYRPKLRLIPDNILKRIAIQDDLVASIIQLRSNQLSAFAVPRRDRFGLGFTLEPNTGVLDGMDVDAKAEFDKRKAAAIDKFNTCGETKGWQDTERCTLADWMRLSVRNALTVGRIATEILWVQDTISNSKKFHSFRAMDAGTIYQATPQRSALQSVRDSAFSQIQQLVGQDKKLVAESFQKDEYKWVQVIDNTPKEVFTADECVVHNFYKVLDVELDGYPVTPIDTMIAAITTHINITTHNKLYFQNGRAARGMIVIKSEDVDQNVLNNIRQQFNAAINNVNNSHRMPVFGIGTEEDLTWAPIDNSSRDMEFQYLTDMNARVILTAFQVSPDELPGWSYLSRGTNSQSLAESNKEYQIEAARDLGIRPVLAHFEVFFNSVIFPLIDEPLSKLCKIRLMGLESDNPEKEAIRLQQNIPINMTYNLVMQKVEQPLVPKDLAGDVPLNPQYQAALNQYVKTGRVIEYFLGVKGAAEDPDLQYYRDAFWFQFQQLKQQAQQMQMAAAQPQPPPGSAPPGGAADGGGGEDPSAAPQGATKDGKPDVQGSNGEGGENNAPGAGGNPAAQAQPDTEDLSRSINQAMDLLSKSESSLPASKRKLLAQHRMTISNFVRGMEEELRDANEQILDLVDKHIKD